MSQNTLSFIILLFAAPPINMQTPPLEGRNIEKALVDFSKKVNFYYLIKQFSVKIIYCIFKALATSDIHSILTQCI